MLIVVQVHVVLWNGVSKCSRLRDIALWAYWGHEFDLLMLSKVDVVQGGMIVVQVHVDCGPVDLLMWYDCCPSPC